MYQAEEDGDDQTPGLLWQGKENRIILVMDSPQHSPSRSAILIDTPVWQDYFRKEKQVFRLVNRLMDTGRICCSDFGVAELLTTAKTQREMDVFQGFTQIFPVLREPAGAWVEAARLSFQLQQKGKVLPLRDCYVAVIAKANGVWLYTTNQDLHRLRRSIGLQLFSKRTDVSCNSGVVPR
jgi:predicted nucleic acid-binding protein